MVRMPDGSIHTPGGGFRAPRVVVKGLHLY
jgi:hypothetical protein